VAAGVAVAAAGTAAAGSATGVAVVEAACRAFSLSRSSASSLFCSEISRSFLFLMSSRSRTLDFSSPDSCSRLAKASRTRASSALVAASPPLEVPPLGRSAALSPAFPSRGGTRARRSPLGAGVDVERGGALVVVGVLSATRVGVAAKPPRHSSTWARTAAAASRADPTAPISSALGMRSTAPRFSALMLSR